MSALPHIANELRRATVVSADALALGRAAGFLLDRNGRTTHFVLEAFGRQRTAIPLGSVVRLAPESVTIDLTAEAVARLPETASLPAFR